jgi:MFS family permease
LDLNRPKSYTYFVHRVMSGLITSPYFRKYFNYPGPIEIGTMVAVLEIGAFGTLNRARKTPRACLTNLNNTVTSIAAGRIGDMIGRKGTLFAGAVVFTMGGAVQTLTVGFWTMILGRVLSGFGVGLLS